MDLIELGSILHMEKGKKPLAQSKEPADGYLPYVDIKAFEQGIIDNYATTEKSLLCEDGDLLIVCDGSRSGLTGRAIKGVVGSTLSKIYADGLSTEYLRYFIQGKYVLLNTRKKGTGTPHLNLNILKASKLVVPSITEQQRIVSRIEELFSSLDNAEEILQKTKEQLAVYRQAVLKEAFNQRDTSKVVELKKIVDDIRIGPFGTMLHKSDYIDSGIPVINPQHIKNQKICPSTRVSISEAKAEELGSYRLRKNDVIMGRRGEMGRTAAVTEKEEGWVCGTGSIVIRLKPEFDAVFYSQILASPDTVHYLEEKSTGTTMKNLNEDIVNHIPVPSITAKEQARIKRELESKISFCDSIEQTIELTLAQAETMRQSILKKAFEGRL